MPASNEETSVSELQETGKQEPLPMKKITKMIRKTKRTLQKRKSKRVMVTV